MRAGLLSRAYWVLRAPHLVRVSVRRPNLPANRQRKSCGMIDGLVKSPARPLVTARALLAAL
jgi:hypothetical protein